MRTVQKLSYVGFDGDAASGGGVMEVGKVRTFPTLQGCAGCVIAVQQIG